MCGIFCSIPICQRGASTPVDSVEPELQQLLERRGPDAANVVVIDGITFGGFTLWQQGDIICVQPCESGDVVLLLNGDIFGGGIEEPGALEQYSFSDTVWLTHQLAQCRNDADYCALFQRLEGPYAVIFYNKQTKAVYYARDSLGRNSLLIELRKQHMRLLSTSYFDASKEAFVMELPPCGLFKFNVITPQVFTLYPWTTQSAEYYAPQLARMETVFDALLTVPCDSSICPEWLSVERLVQAPVFDFYELCKDWPVGVAHDDVIQYLRSCVEVESALMSFSALLERSVRDRVQKTTQHCNICTASPQRQCNHAKIAILFSGGIDCTILACLADKFVPHDDPIDLINVAFECVNKGNIKCNADQWLVPDRLTALASLAELQRLCPNRKWQLIEVNITRAELHTNLLNHIKHLIYPLDKVLDESIGACFWHAANGCGTTARIVIVGSGADELFGGYQRHRRAFQRASEWAEKHKCVVAELDKDWQRIASRNLARDDRVIADSSKTLRAPFIEENVVKFINGSLQPNQRCCFLLEEGLGDKLFLRLYGHLLGLRSSVSFKKRAIQFGSKIANKKQNADDRSMYLNFET